VYTYLFICLFISIDIYIYIGQLSSPILSRFAPLVVTLRDEYGNLTLKGSDGNDAPRLTMSILRGSAQVNCKQYMYMIYIYIYIYIYVCVCVCIDAYGNLTVKGPSEDGSPRLTMSILRGSAQVHCKQYMYMIYRYRYIYVYI